MDKKQFLDALRAGLQGLPPQELEDRISFYSEVIEDSIEDGLSEQEAVKAVGPVNEIIFQIVDEMPLYRLAAQKVRGKRKPGTAEILLIVLGSPVWLPLLLAAFAVVFSVYVSLWSVIISLYAAAVALFGCALGACVLGVVSLCRSELGVGLCLVGIALAVSGVGILLMLGTNGLTKGLVWLTKCVCRLIKRSIVGEGRR